MKKKKDIFGDQFERLKERVIFRAEYLNVDLTDLAVAERLLNISNGASDVDGDTNEEWEAATWPERIFAVAFRCSTAHLSDENEVDLLAALCLGNWAIGFVDGLPGDHPGPNVCVSCLIKQHTSAIGKAGAVKRHSANAALREWAIGQYQAATWKSANQAAHALKEDIIEHGRKIGAHLSEENAQRTIAEWFRKSV